MFRAAALAAMLMLLASCARAGAVEATIPQGRLAGLSEAGVETFKHIPYAAPPVGARRWRPPGPPPSWSGVRPAQAFGPACMQPGRGLAMSEDCLTLNVWAPAGAKRGANLPVMVWIHGGAFVWGTGGTDFYDGSNFARRGIVVVTINYRLGRFGFFAHPALTAESPKGPLANYGLMDQIAALKWVKANIAAFGGDPTKVTIAGESAGAMSVNYLMISPLARSLFARAISESGFARVIGPPMRGVVDSAEAGGARFAAALGVTGSGPQAAAALRALPAEKINVPPAGLLDPTRAQPIIDGVLVPSTVAVAFAAGREAKVPFLVGANSWEASLFAREIAKDPKQALARAGTDQTILLALYAGETTVRTAMDSLTDSAVVEPDRFQAQCLTRDGEPAFVYYFGYLPAAERSKRPGAAHGEEIGYVFDNLPKEAGIWGGEPYAAATPQDRAISGAMNAYWAAFVRSGDPGGAGGPSCPRWRPADGMVMEFGADGPVARPRFEEAKLDFFAARAGR